MNNEINFFTKYKKIALILYSIISLPGLSIIFLFPPKTLLFIENSVNDRMKQSLFKDFVKNIYENIKKHLIKEIRFSEENKPCPDNFEELVIINQYYGNFTKFYGNASFCIKRFLSFVNVLLQPLLHLNDNQERSANIVSLIFLFLEQILDIFYNHFEQEI